MRLGIDITPLQVSASGGIGVATYETLRALSQQRDGVEIVLYGRSRPLVPFSNEPLDLGLELRLGRGPASHAGNIAWLRYGVAPMLDRDRIDVFWGTRHVLPGHSGRVALVATLYDFWYLHHPEEQPFANRVLNRMVVSAAARRGDVLTAISDATGDEARALFPGSASRVRTVHLGVDSARFAPAPDARVAEARATFGVAGPFVLALDVHNPRKNFAAVLEAAARMPASVPPFDIVAAGAPRSTARHADLAAAAERLGLLSRVRFVGDVSQEDLRALYTGCSAFVYPSDYEGFGMPVLEAMACGAPVACSSASSLPEVAGDAALMFDPASPPEIASALSRILGDRLDAERLREKGRDRVSLFTWSRTAERMRQAFEDAIAAHGEERG